MCPMGSNHSPREEQLVQIKCKDAKSRAVLLRRLEGLIRKFVDARMCVITP